MSELRSRLELAKLKHEIQQEQKAALHAERVRVYGPAKAEALRRADVIREMEAEAAIRRARDLEYENALRKCDRSRRAK